MRFKTAKNEENTAQAASLTEKTNVEVGITVPYARAATLQVDITKEFNT